MVTDWPATTTDAVRALLVFAETAKVTAPDPAPVAPALITIHGTSVRALHAHPVGALTVILLFPPEDGIVSWVEERSYLHGAAS